MALTPLRLASSHSRGFLPSARTKKRRLLANSWSGVSSALKGPVSLPRWTAWRDFWKVRGVRDRTLRRLPVPDLAGAEDLLGAEGRDHRHLLGIEDAARVGRRVEDPEALEVPGKPDVRVAQLPHLLGEEGVVDLRVDADHVRGKAGADLLGRGLEPLGPDCEVAELPAQPGGGVPGDDDEA